ncbi:hypothetical protein [Desulfolutivibrio sulfoxidireducens]|uniref:hypothetical protein n=1 Tax=Desulfolutivibrio sulfoxidireducens TaxID=2773299 RepID=UPI001C40339F|nr:hypothetical protein [Desulfolutivibrio sulfoxidireducens]
MQLLSPQSDLVAISIEGSSPNEAESPVSVGEELIDIAEYYKSEDIKDARLIRYMQLKHSTLHAAEHWTASGLEKTIIGFAKRYSELRKDFSAEVLASKLEFWFVTNRPISTDFTEAVSDVAVSILPRHPNELKKLKKIVEGAVDDLCAFAKLLRFEGRQDDYWEQRNILAQETYGYLSDADAEGPLKLKEIVLKRALSEGEANRKITKIDVLRALGTDESRIFPAPCLIEKVKFVVPRAHDSDILNAIVSATAPLVIHASAGVGKSIFAMLIASGLPDGSTCIVYDCFGNSQYRNPTGYRHRHKDALVQVANELAAQGLCHPLIPTSHADTSSYMRAFIYRISHAATKVGLLSPHGLLCIVIDAADNAQIAAEEIGERRCFAQDLIREKMPDNVRLVFLCRTHRLHLLSPPHDAIEIELTPFIREETAAHLRQRFPEATSQDIDEFHRLSSQNPRVQALALSRHKLLPEILRLLGPNPTTVEDSIGSLLESAIVKLKDKVGTVEKDQIEKICAGLAVLRPLIPVPILAKISGVEEQAIKSFALDLGRPLLLVGDTLQFFDEPAETWFREQFKPDFVAMTEFIAKITPLSRTSAYVASVLPQLMLETEKFSELVKLALRSDALPENSLLEKQDVELRMLQFALKAGLRSKRYLDAAKLALKAGEVTAGDHRQRSILQANTDLAAVFLGTDFIQEIVSRRIFGTSWFGSHYAYDAALMADRKELVGEARSHLRMADEWLRKLFELPEEERRHEDISDQDIVALTFAYIGIYGPKHGSEYLRLWRPREISFRVGRIVAKRLIDHGRFQDVDRFAKAAGNNLCLVLAVAIELREVRRYPPVEVVRRSFRLIANPRVLVKSSHREFDKESELDSITALIEAALQHKVCTLIQAANVLSRYLPSEPPRGIASRFSGSRFILLRAYCLRAALQGDVLTPRDLAYAKLKEEIDKNNQQYTSGEIQKFQRTIGALLLWHQLWAETYLGKVTKESFVKELAKAREKSKETIGYYKDEFGVQDEIAELWFEVLQNVEALDEKHLADFKKWKNALKRIFFTSTLTTLARRCGQQEATKGLAIEFALEAFKINKDNRSDAKYMADGYLDAARAVLTTSKVDAKAYFDEAVAVACKIGDESLARWDAILHLAIRAAKPDSFSPEVAYHFARCAELTHSFNDDHFPWRTTIESLCGLCPSSALAILSRWRDRKFGWHEEILPVAIDRLIKQGSLDARDACALICFQAEWKFDQFLDQVLTACPASDEKQAAADHLYRYIQFVGGDFSKINDVITRHKVTVTGIDEAIAFEEKSRESNKKCEHYSSHSQRKPDYNWEKVFADHDIATPDGLSHAYAAYKNTEHPFYHDIFFKEAIQRVPLGSEATTIKAMGDVSEFGLYHFREFLNQIPGTWKGRPATTRALKETVKVYCRRYCMEISKNRYDEVLPFQTTCELTEMSEAEIIGAVLDAIGETPDLVDASRLYSLVGLLVTILSEEDAFEALQFGLDLFTPMLEDKDGDGPWSKKLSPPTEVKASLAGYIWASLAAPEGVLRWEGSHAILSLAALGRREVLSHLFGLAKEQKGEVFVDANLPFYRLHALQWFLIGVARAAMDFPAVIVPFALQVVDWALKDQPHVLIRQFAACAVLALIREGLFEDQNDIAKQMASINSSPFPVINSKYCHRIKQIQQANPGVGEDVHLFGFWPDIGPYWYEPLGRVFALSQREIEVLAINVIHNEIGGQVIKAWNEDKRHSKRLYQERHTHHSHGGYPLADTLDFYQAYHAMMIVAGSLLATTPTHHDFSYDEKDEFSSWIDRYNITRKDGRWLWDRRDQTPFERPTWIDLAKDGAPVGGPATNDDHDEALHAGNMLNVWGTWTVAGSNYKQTVNIRSALVPPDKSSALLRALGTVANIHAYGIPSAGGDLEIDEDGFVLKGWVEHNYRDSGLDHQDRWAGEVEFPPPMPARGICELIGLTTDPDRRYWQDAIGDVAIVSQEWGHYDEAVRHKPNNPERGSRLQASIYFLTTMLSKLGMDMIIEVHIERDWLRLPYDRGSYDEKDKIPSKARIYLLDANGKLRTL